MSSPLTDAFLAECPEELLPEALRALYIPLEILNDDALGQTILCKSAATGALVILKKCGAGFARTEAALLARLSHPGLPALAGFSEVGGDAFVARAYVPGLPLDESARRPMPVGTALDVTERVLDVLSYLHAQSPPVVHRDVKPSNIIIDPGTGSVSLIDLGIARVYQENASGDTLCMGTRDFAPPEQYGFMPTGPRADVYAAGAVLRWMLADDAAGLTPALRRFLKRMTAFDPKARYPDARAALAALRRCRRGTARKAARAAAVAASAVLIAGFGFWLGRYTQVDVAPLNAIFDRNPAVEFADPVLEARLRGQIEAPDGPVTARAALDVRALDLSAPSPDAPKDARITDISALSAFRNLRSLDLSWNEIQDIAPLAGLTTLEALYLNGNGGITDLTPLSGLVNMKDIMLVGCQVFSDSAGVFERMEGLETFWVESPRLKTLDVIEHFPGLTKLVVKNCGVSDLSRVLELQDLRQIDVSGSPVADFTPLLKLAHLAYATFSEDQRALVEAQLGDAAFDINYA